MKDKQYRTLQENFKKFLTEENQIQVPIFLYHISKKEDEPAIKQQGLIANTGNTTDTYPGRIYFTNSLQAATARYKKFLETEPIYQGAVVFKIDTSKLQGVPFYRDIKGDGIYTNADIPKDAIASVSRFGGTPTTQVANEMAVAPQDVNVFSGKNYSSIKLSNKVESLIDEAIQYLNSGKKGKKPAGLMKSSIQSNQKILLVFAYDDNTASVDSDLVQLYGIIKTLDSNWMKDDELKKKYPKEYATWEKVKSSVKKRYLDAGWNEFIMSRYNDRDKRGFAASLYK